MTVKITHPSVTIRELTDRYMDGGEDNLVTALGGRLNIRPLYQRAFVYGPADRDNVIRSVYNGLPLNSMYWAVNPDGTYEVIDGQQRIISICQYITNDDGYRNPVAVNFNGRQTQTFQGLSPEKRREILDYELQVYLCDGTPDEKLEWFHTINIAGKPMTNQELLNADYTGSWLTDAKRFFSCRHNNRAINMCFYNNKSENTLLSVNGEAANRQALLELALRWISDSDPVRYPDIKNYMALHCNDADASGLIGYFIDVITWVRRTFTVYRKDLMKGADWGILYNKYRSRRYDPKEINKTLDYLCGIYDEDPDGLHKGGFLEYALSGDRTLIWKRLFSPRQQKQAYKNQKGRCAVCGRAFPLEKLEAHHKKAYADGGETVISNCLMLCHDCHADITAHQNSED